MYYLRCFFREGFPTAFGLQCQLCSVFCTEWDRIAIHEDAREKQAQGYIIFFKCESSSDVKSVKFRNNAKELRCKTALVYQLSQKPKNVTREPKYVSLSLISEHVETSGHTSLAMYEVWWNLVWSIQFSHQSIMDNFPGHVCNSQHEGSFSWSVIPSHLQSGRRARMQPVRGEERKHISGYWPVCLVSTRLLWWLFALSLIVGQEYKLQGETNRQTDRQSDKPLNLALVFISNFFFNRLGQLIK